MPIGYLVTVAIVSAGALFAVLPVRRPWSLGIACWLLSAVVNESPVLALSYLLGATVLALTQPAVDAPAVWSVFAVGCALLLLATPVLVLRSLKAGPVIEGALHGHLGERWRWPGTRGMPWGWVLFAPLPLVSPGVRRTRNRRYGPHRRNRLDVYVRRGRPPAGAPVLVHLHGGAFRSGRKSFYARPLLHTLAGRGWVCVSASYRLRPASYEDMVVDVKRVIAWVREHGREYGVDPARIVLAGSSAGAHLALSAAFTPDAARFQPGFESTDTTVSGVVGLYGYYGTAFRGPAPSSPLSYVHPGLPPVFIAHGAQDTLVPASSVRDLVAALRAVSSNPVLYAELPGAQHTFDLLHSIRFALVVEGVDAFATWACERQQGGATRASVVQ